MDTNIEKLLNQYGAVLNKGIALAEADMSNCGEYVDLEYTYAEGMRSAYSVALGIFEQMFADFGQVEVEQECNECGEMSDDMRGDLCKDCDKQFSGPFDTEGGN